MTAAEACTAGTLQGAFSQKDGEHGDGRWRGMGGESGEDDLRGSEREDGRRRRLHVCETREVGRYKGRTDQALRTWKFVEIPSFLIAVQKQYSLAKFSECLLRHTDFLPPLFK